MTKKALLILLLVLVSIGIFLFIKLSPIIGSHAIRISGNIEATTMDLSFKIPGRVKARYVDEGEQVKQGQVVATLENSQLSQAVAQRKSDVLTAKFALEELLHGSRPQEILEAKALQQRAKFALEELLHGSRKEDIAGAKAAVRQTRAEAIRARADYKRNAQLYQEGFISAQQYDLAKTTAKTDIALLRQAEERLRLLVNGPRIEEIQQARENLTQVNQQLSLTLEGPRKEEIAQARARLKSMQALLAQAETQLKDATLVSPITGIVLTKNVEPNEYVSAGTPVITVSNLSDVWVRTYLDETDLGRVKFNQPAQVTTDTYPGKIYQGRVSFISSESEFTPKSVQTEKERVKLVYRIKVDIANPNQELKPGMPADVKL